MIRHAALLVALLAGLAGRPALAQFDAPSPAKPEVLLLLDDSVLWQSHYVTGVAPDCVACTISGDPLLCTVDAVGLQEALTGAYAASTMTCDNRQLPVERPDAAETVGHFKVRFTAQPTPDGAIDQAGDAIKFGLMTVDHAADTSTLLVGEFSYGDDVTCSWFDGTTTENVTFNLGAKSESATYGRRVPLQASDDGVDVLATNEAVQQAIKNDIPWGTFPASALLTDAIDYLTTDPHFAPWDPFAGTGDPYSACRQRAAVLITHSPDDVRYVDADAGCLKTTLDRANELTQTLGVPLYAISYRADAPARALADELALLGGTDAAYHVTGPAALKAVMSSILDRLTAYGDSFTEVVTTTATRSNEDALYEIFSGFGRTLGRLDPYGVLYNLILRCHDCTDQADGGPEACASFEFGGALAYRADASRTVFTQQGGLATPFTHAALDAAALSIPTSGALIDLTPTNPCTTSVTWNPSQILGLADDDDPATGLPYYETFADQVVSFVRGDETSRRCDRPLGAIRYATPAISAAPALALSAPGYGMFKAEEGLAAGDRRVKDRPTVLYAATHTGMLHAFRLDRPPAMADDEYGQELWAYVPGFLLPRLHDLPLSLEYLLDGSVVVRDVLTLATSTMSLAELGHAWRTLAVVSCGTGCRGLFALDVTEPDAPQFLWEVEPGRRCYSNDAEGQGCVATSDYDDLGYTVSKPDFGLVWVADVLGETDPHQRGVVLLGSGAKQGAGAHVGEGFFVLDALTGRIVRQFGDHVPGPPAVEPPGQFKEEMVGGVAGYNTFPGRITNRVFAGDAAGQLWRFDLSNSDPDEWTGQRFFDVRDVLGGGDRPPLYEAPALALDTTGSSLIVTLATGGVRALGDPLATHVVTAVREAFTLAGGVATLTPQTLWQHVLNAGEIPTGRPVVYNSATYFSTYVSDLTDPCLMGGSRVYGVRFVESDSGGDFVGALDVDGAIDQTYVELADTFLTGVHVVLRPGCVGEVPDTWMNPTPTSGASTTGTPTLVASAGFGGTSSPGQVPDSATAEPPVASQSLPLTGTPRTLIYSSWGLIFE